MHKCIDENCPVHSLSKIKLLTSGSVTFCNDISEKSDNKFNEHHKFNDNCTVKTPTNHTTGTLKNITEYFTEKEDTSVSNFGLKALTQQHEDHVDEASRTNKDISDIDKPKFMCTWLNNNVDINKFPLYKKAVYYGNLKTVRNEFAIYSTSVTNHIWTSKKDTDAPKEAGCTSGGKDTTFVKGGKASKSNENIFENIESVLKDSRDIDITDLKLKYAFLFNPRFRTINMAHAKGETYPYGIEIRNIWTPQNCNSKSKGETLNVENECNNSFPKGLSTTNTTNNDSVQNLVCSDPDHVDLKLYPRYQQLHINNQTLVFQESSSESSLHHYNSTATDKTVQNLAINCEYKYGRRNSGAPNTYCKTEYGSHSSNDSFSYADKSVQLPFNATHIQCSESPDNSYSPASDPMDKFTRQNVLPQTPVGNSYIVDRNTSPAIAYLHLSPLVSSPAFSHYISPAQQLHSPAYAGQTYHFYTKRNCDPRLEAKKSGSTSGHVSDRRMHDQHNLHTPILHSFSVSPGSRRGRDINHCPPIETSRHTADSRRTERQTRKRREDQSVATWEDEDPLGLSYLRKTARQLSPGEHIKNRDSEAFYSTDESKNDETLFKNRRMDNYQELVGSYSSPLAASYRSRPARYSPYYVERSRYRVSLHARYSRDRSRSREISASKSRSSTSYRCRRSKSSPTHRHHNLSLESSRDHRQSGKSIQDRFNRRSVFITDRKSNNSHRYTNNNNGKNELREKLRESARCDKNYTRENESNRKRLSETKTASKCINRSFEFLEYKEPRLSNYNDRRQRPPSQRRNGVSSRLKSTSKR